MGTPLTTPPAAAALLQRAAALRALAGRIESSKVLELRPHVGSETWIGPKAFDCAADIARIIARFAIVTADLRNAARRLELQAAAEAITCGPH